MSVIHVGEGVFVDKDPISEDDIRKALGDDWKPAFEGVKVYPYVEFASLERAYYGLQIRPKGPKGQVAASIQVGEQGFENIAPLNDLKDAIKELAAGHRHSFEEYPFSEITTLKDYKRVLAALPGGDPDDPRTWSPKGRRRESAWTGPGVYDLRDKPPAKHTESVEAYELVAMDSEASGLFDFMFDGEDWKGSLRTLLLEEYDPQESE